MPGRALVDSAAQHGLIGRETLEKLDQYLLTNFGMKVQYSGEGGGTVRGVCGAEERTPIAYVPIGWWLFRAAACANRAWTSAMPSSTIFVDRHGQRYRHGRLDSFPHQAWSDAADA